ncbi:rod-binding protein [Thiomicrospira sp. ALE5]|uniref:rod-binding protein n=1 Tax=Thiomicrospira sp. ALE5 TaxID=748650 RepID=UPI0008E1A27C|nr:rod-binding protein [Thiomicrospira sp. ALE5]SFR59505.1 flagellar protein FlgJ [Thiomicrospira sp. ALE5]
MSLVSMDHQNVMNLQGFGDLRRQAREDQQSALRPVAEQFEAMMLQQILKTAHQTRFDDGWLEGSDYDTYKDLYHSQLSQHLAAQGSVGLADLIVEQLAPTLPTATTDAYLNQRLDRI